VLRLGTALQSRKGLLSPNTAVAQLVVPVLLLLSPPGVGGGCDHVGIGPRGFGVPERADHQSSGQCRADDVQLQASQSKAVSLLHICATLSMFWICFLVLP